MKEENENISFDFFLQVSVLVITEMQMQLFQYWNIFCVFILSNKLKNASCHIVTFRSKHWDLFFIATVPQDMTKIFNSFLQNWS